MGADKKASSGIRAGRLSLLVLTFFFVTPFTVGQSRSHNSNAASGFVQENYATPQTAESTVTVTYTKAQIAGDTNIIAIGWNSSSSTVSSVTDSEGNSYQLAVPLATGDGLSETIYYAANINAASAGNNVVSVNFSAAVPAADIRALEYGGLAAASHTRSDVHKHQSMLFGIDLNKTTPAMARIRTGNCLPCRQSAV